ncbi:MAG: diphthine synthase [Candidatus Nitrosopelagicus sp.]|jgi:diphthine synthase|nr:diphthine synthase [Candidatus Nitrosopelagicus sp.]
MLWFIGLGVSGISELSDRTISIIKNAEIVYLESFTSPISEIEKEQLENITDGEFKIAKRWLVEDGNEILNNAKQRNTVLISYGDPYIATTHLELKIRAIKDKVKTNTIHSSSIVSSLIGEAGLHYYKVGKILTIMNDPKSMITPYNVIFDNLLRKVHSVILLEYNEDKSFFLEPQNALSLLLGVEKTQNGKIISPNTFVIVASRIGKNDQKILSGKISNLMKREFGEPPHSIIIPGSLHFTESDAVKIVTECLDQPVDNSTSVKGVSEQMIEKYVPMVREALNEIKPHYENLKEYEDVLINAKLYIDDAENFLKEGKKEYAVLSIGYADGLVDALRIAKGLDPKM